MCCCDDPSPPPANGSAGNDVLPPLRQDLSLHDGPRTPNTAGETIAEKAATYAMPGFRIDGNDPLEIYATAKTAIERARAGEGPTLIEAMTFRFEGHVFGDNDAYMDPGEKDARRKDDPWPRYRSYLIDNGKATEAELDAIDETHKQTIDAAMQFALDSPFPDVAEVRRDVYEYEVVE